ncbi:MAG: hypothetical protein WCE90_09085 [Candidatus Zixiibacteriota bacterium]
MNTGEQSTHEIAKDLEGVKLYKPGVIAAYLVLGGLPVGLFLYGLNIARRDQRWLGVFFCTMSAAAFLMLVTVAARGHGALGVAGLGIAAAYSVYRIERRPYDLAIQRGATPAKWWPPLFAVLGTFILIIIAVVLFGPQNVPPVP